MVLRAVKAIYVLLFVTVSMCSAQTDQNRLSVVYTGKLFGYYRIESGEKAPFRLEPVRQFFQMSRTGQRANSLLLSMGDNFAPEMGAAVQLGGAVSPCKGAGVSSSKDGPPISVYKSDCRFAATAEDDNVANFLMKAGYRAIVPGREDFIYGAVWLNRLAGLLQDSGHGDPARPAIANVDKKLIMLAANLRVKFSPYSKSSTENPILAKMTELCPLFLGRDLLTPSSETCTASDTPTTFDWLDRFDRALQSAQKEGPGSRITREMEVSNDQSMALRRRESIRTRQTFLANETKAMMSMLPPNGGGEWATVRNALKKLATADDEIVALKETVSDDANGRGQVCDALSLGEALAGAGFSSSRCSEQKMAETRAALVSLLQHLRKDCNNKGRDRWTNELCEYGTAVVQQYSDEAAHYAERPDSSYRGVVAEVLLDSKVLEVGREALLQAIAAEQLDIGYTEATLTDADGQDIGTALVVGVVGQESMRAISQLNKDICIEISAGKPAVIAADPSGCAKGEVRLYEQHVHGTVKAIDPVRTVRTVLRAAESVHGKYQYRILMAQMPHTEAEELAVHLQHPGDSYSGAAPPLDLILSEAQSDHASVSASVSYDRLTPAGDSPWSVTPVLTPLPAYRTGRQRLVRAGSTVEMTANGLFRPDSSVEIATNGSHRTATNFPAEDTPFGTGKDTTLHLLMKAVEQQGIHFDRKDNGNYYSAQDCDPNGAAYTNNEEPCKEVVIQFLLNRMQLAAHSDVAMLERRDLFLEMLPEGYTDYDAICRHDPDCELRVALDRVLWKGDYFERVMLSGKDLGSVMTTAGKLSGDAQSLQAQDTFQQWVVTFGMVRPRQPNLTLLGVRSTEFSVMQDSRCSDVQEQAHPSAGGDTMYCVNGQPLIPDHAYFVATSDGLAEDTAVYSTMSAMPADYRETPNSPWCKSGFRNGKDCVIHRDDS